MAKPKKQSETSRRAWVVAKLIAPASAKLILHTLNLHADNRGFCWPSVATLSAETSLTRRTVQRTLNLLEAAGLIHRGIRRRQRKRYDSSLYRLVLRGVMVALPLRNHGAENVPEKDHIPTIHQRTHIAGAPVCPECYAQPSADGFGGPCFRCIQSRRRERGFTGTDRDAPRP